MLTPLCCGESSLRTLSWYIFPLFLRDQSLSKITSMFQFGNKFQISVKFHANLIFEVCLYFKFCAGNFIEILLTWYSWDTFQLVDFLIIEKRMRLKRSVHLKKQKISTHKHAWSKQNYSKWKNPNKISNYTFHISNFTEGFYNISRSDCPLTLLICSFKQAPFTANKLIF